ncbi:MAG: hypothetical protein H6707_18915 [Deltaproteobacteria bacterium]|nr:hypothetical protein [Deltaproteobacteria bacterium]
MNRSIYRSPRGVLLALPLLLACCGTNEDLPRDAATNDATRQRDGALRPDALVGHHDAADSELGLNDAMSLRDAALSPADAPNDLRASDAGPIDSATDAISSDGPPASNARGQCNAAGWCLDNPLPFSSAPANISASAIDDVWAVARGGRVARYDGSQWIPVDVATTADLTDVWVESSSRSWIVGKTGNSGLVVRVDRGSGGPTSYSAPYALNAVHGVAGQATWAVGNYGTIFRLRNSGPPDLAKTPTIQNLRAVFVLNAKEAWAVGTAGMILHYDGVAWLSVASGVSVTLTGVWAASSNDVWAVGENGTILHFDGSKWLPLTFSPTQQTIADVYGVSAKQVYIVADPGAGDHSVYRFDGTQFAPIANGDPARLSFHTLWANSSELWTAGYRAGGPSIRRLRGGTWQDISVGPVDDLRAVAAISPDRAIAVGDKGLVLQRDQTGWKAQRVGKEDLWDVYATSANNIWAVGRNRFVVQYDGAQWKTHAPQLSGEALAVWTSAKDDVWVASSSGDVERFDGQKWTGATKLTTASIGAIHGISKTDSYAVSSQGEIFHFNGTQWTPIKSGTTFALRDIWAVDAQKVWIVGDGGTVLLGNHKSGFTKGTSSASGDLISVAADAKGETWALAWSGAAFRWTGLTWKRVDIEPPPSFGNGWLVDLGGGPQGGIWATGATGRVYRFNP